MSPNIGLSDGQRQGVIQILTPLLADEYMLYTKTHNYHWNVVGPQFNDLHDFFQAQYTELTPSRMTSPSASGRWGNRPSVRWQSSCSTPG